MVQTELTFWEGVRLLQVAAWEKLGKHESAYYLLLLQAFNLKCELWCQGLFNHHLVIEYVLTNIYKSFLELQTSIQTTI